MTESEARRIAEDLVASAARYPNCRLKSIRYIPLDPTYPEYPSSWAVQFNRDPRPDELHNENGADLVWQEDDFLVIVQVDDETGEATFFDSL